MSREGNGQPERFHVDCSGLLIKKIEHFHSEAKAFGRAKAFREAIQRIMHRLERDARNAGEPLFRLPVMKLTVRTIVDHPLAVDYAVHDEQPLVFIKVKLMKI